MMNQTIRLFDEDSHLYDFSAEVISCEKTDSGYCAVLDRTAFFPEGGGQYADSGTINGIAVSDVQIKDGIILHYLPEKLEVGSDVSGCVDGEIRFRRMQNHSGEHIVSGLIHKYYGFDNVGFHLGKEFVTIDISGYLTKDELSKIEKEANKAVYKNVRITAEYPSDEVLAKTEYRSKLELTENVRLVTIEGYDVCACCAPHVSFTGEIGIIKFLDSIKYKGGTRLHILCGADAYDDYDRKCRISSEISALLKANQNELDDAVKRLLTDGDSYRQKISELKRQLIGYKTAQIEKTDGNIVVVEEDLDIVTLRHLVNEVSPLCSGICVGLSGNDTDGYDYIMSSRTVPLREKAKEINSALCGRGGGKDEMIQGSLKATAEEVRNYFGV